MSKPADYPKAVRAFVSRHDWTTEALQSRAVIDIAARFGKTGDAVRADIRRHFMARMKPPATMMNVAFSYKPFRRPIESRPIQAVNPYPMEPTRPIRK